jgi:mono/diheme cytochrome c family protein
MIKQTASKLILPGILLLTWSAMAGDKWDINKFDPGKLPPVADKQGVTYANDIQPLFEASCVRCHGEERQKGQLRLDNVESTLKGGKDGKIVVIGDSKKSLLVAAAAQIDDDTAMPPKHRPGGPGGPPPDGHGESGGPGGFGPPPKALTAEQVGLIRAWIDQGAK